ncbi:hypothetical protein [Caldisalinibacter kiritimatiensis]|uniref:Uncharacterized protein n=1 Tax=Caldisalinibacter kiritimatiensis TaxID=1304284 RepID=R1ASB4_9FIRM|nr:hypothetical protein [Caldisalinibacter kiritimatiensis]EOD00018.1 hypothetical protein L21TH_1907 [Caldisalinibacter kiritimatiensis]
MIKTILGIVFFAIATMFIYSWGYVKEQRTPNNLQLKLYKKAENKVVKKLEKKEYMTFKEISKLLSNLKVSEFGTKKRLIVKESNEFTKGLLKDLVNRDVVKIDYKSKPKKYYLNQ